MKHLYPLAALLIALSFSNAAFAHGTDKGDISYMDQAIAKLSKQDAAQFRDTMKQAHEKNMAIADQIHALHDDIDDIMVAKTFDEDAFRAKSAKLRDVYETMRSNTDDAFASAIAKLPQSERKSIADAVAYPHEKHQAANSAQ